MAEIPKHFNTTKSAIFSMEKKPIKVLVVDWYFEAWTAFFHGIRNGYIKGLNYKLAQTPGDAIELMKAEKFDAIVLDINTVANFASGLLSEIKKRQPRAGIGVYSGMGTMPEELKKLPYLGKGDVNGRELVEWIAKIAKEAQKAKPRERPLRRIDPKKAESQLAVPRWNSSTKIGQHYDRMLSDAHRRVAAGASWQDVIKDSPRWLAERLYAESIGVPKIRAMLKMEQRRLKKAIAVPKTAKRQACRI